MKRMLVGLALLSLVGCGPSARELREQTLSILNTEADRWDGGKDFETSITDAYGRPVTGTAEKGMLNYVLELRSNGPDGLPKNSDDIVVTRSKRHGETTLSKEAAKAAETVSEGAASGAVKGVRKGLGFGGKEKKE
jgi:hypothetical protein